MYNPGPGASFQRRTTKDTDLLTLVEEYLNKNKEKSYVNMDDMVKTLQASSYRYSRMKKGAFAAQVKTAYNKYIQMHTRNQDDDEDDDDFGGPGTNSNVEPLQSYRESELLDKVSSDSDIEIVDQKGDDTLSPVSTSCTPSGRPSTYHHHEASSSGFVTSTNQNLNASFNNSNSSSSGGNLRNNHHYQQNVSSAVRQRGLKRKHGLENNDSNSYVNPSSNLHNSNSNSDVSQQESVLDSRKSVKLTSTTTPQSSNAVSTNSTNKQSYTNSTGNPISSVKKSRKEVAVLQSPDITFKDFAGCEKVIEEICQLLLHLKHPEIYKTLGVTPPRGFLLHGPPGCGKTLLANAIAGETNLPMLKMAATELISGVSGESEGNIRNLFQQAVDIAPCIIFLDEIDSITPKRETAQREMERRIVAQMLACIDELGTKEKGDLVVLIGATNRLETIDSALRRAGRFDREISLGIPDEPAREKILRVICNTLRLEPNFSFNLLAKLTPGYVGADLQALAREAAIHAISEIISHGSSKENKKDDNTNIEDSCQVKKTEAINPITKSIDSKDEKLNEGSLDTSMSSIPASPEKQKQVNETESENGNEKEIIETENNETIEKEQQQQEPENKKDEEPVASTSSSSATPTLDENNESNENKTNNLKDSQTIKDETPSQSDETSTAPLSIPEETQTKDDDKQDPHEIITIDVDEKSNEASTSSKKNNNNNNDTTEDAMLVDIADDEDDDGLYDNIINKNSDTASNYERVSPGVIDVDDVDDQMDIIQEEIKTESVSLPQPLVFPIHSAYKWIHDVSAPLSQQQLDKIFIEMRHFEEALKYVQPSAKREGFATVPDTTWNDIGALKDIRDELQVSILGPVKYSAAFQALGINNPAGVLLCGPPGCGKTLLAKAVANEAGINFISVKGPELLNMYVGESERAVRQCFLRAKNSSPCVIFFDELDALCPRRSDGGDGNSTSRVVNQLLTEMDGMESRRGVFIMAATNRPDIIDPAILRPGRLDKILFVDLPKVEDRIDILKTITKKGAKPKLDNDVDLDEIATTCQNYTGADLAALVREASVAAFRELVLKPNIEANTEQDISATDESNLKVSKRHFDAAFLKIKPSVSKKDLEKYAGMKEKYSQLN